MIIITITIIIILIIIIIIKIIVIIIIRIRIIILNGYDNNNNSNNSSYGNYYISNNNNTCIDSESSLRLLQAIYNSKYINMSRIESFPLSYQVLFKYAQISSKNLIEISFKKKTIVVWKTLEM